MSFEEDVSFRKFVWYVLVIATSFIFDARKQPYL